jgi:hypothetical protein
MGKKTGEMVSMVLLGRDLAHRAHWKTTSYAEHMALGAFYEGILVPLDAFVEQYQGQFNQRLEVPLGDNDFEGDISEILDQQLMWIEKNRQEICPKNETALNNVLDEIAALYQSTLYKLRFLS